MKVSMQRGKEECGAVQQRVGKEWRMVKQGKEKNGEWLCSEEQRNGGWTGRERGMGRGVRQGGYK